MIERNFDNYINQIEKVVKKGGGKSFGIEQEFVPVPVNGEIEVVLRLLPQPRTEEQPFVENRTHSFQGSDGKWHVVDCLRKAGHRCPICEWNKAVFDTFTSEDAKKISKKKAKKTFICNVYVVKNNAKPDTEGKIFRFKFGIQIAEKIFDKMSPKDDPDKGHIEGVQVFDYYKGANLIYKAKIGKYGPNPEASYFGDSKPISDKNNVPLSEAEIKRIDDSLLTLKECEKDTSKVTFEDVLNTYEKLCEGEKLFKRIPKEDGTMAYEPILPGISAGNTAATNAAVQSAVEEPAVDKAASAESTDEFLKDLL